MTRTATTKLVATALAVASLGLASTAHAKGDVADPVEPTPAPAPATPAPAPAPATPAEQEAPAAEEAPATEPSQEELDKQRYERYCHMKDAEPSHNDKKFCEDNKGRFEPGTTTSTTGGGGKTTTTGGGRKCNENGTREYCYDNDHKYEEPSYEKASYKPVYTAKKALGKELPFTGLEIWQLGLIGIVLAGGGIGARRMLAS